MNSKSHIGFWLIAFLCALFIVPYFVKADVMRSRLVAELESVRTSLGDQLGNVVVGGTNGIYNTTVVATGLQAAMEQFKHSESERRLAQDIGTKVLVAAADSADGYFQALAMQIYAVILRGVIVLLWVFLLLPFVAAILVDGLMARAKKFELLGFQNPTAFAAGTHLVVLIGVIPLVYIVAPFPMSPLFMPYWGAIAALPLSFAIQHMQPILTR